MEKKKFGKDNTEKRKNSFNKKLCNGDMGSIQKFMSICTSPDEEMASEVDEKIERIWNKMQEIVSEEFSLDEIKQFDCKFITDELLDYLLSSKYIEKAYQLAAFCDEDEDIFIYPFLIDLSDGTSIKVVAWEIDDGIIEAIENGDMDFPESDGDDSDDEDDDDNDDSGIDYEILS